MEFAARIALIYFCFCLWAAGPDDDQPYLKISDCFYWKLVTIETYGIKKFDQKYMLVLFYYPPEWGLLQNIKMSFFSR